MNRQGTKGAKKNTLTIVLRVAAFLGEGVQRHLAPWR